MEKLCRTCAPKASPRPLSILLNNTKKKLHAIIFQKNNRSWNTIIKKTLKSQKVNFVLSFEPSPF